MTPKQLASLPAGTHPMSAHPGLRLEVRGKVKTWTLRRRGSDGKLKQQALGHYPEISLAGAIAAAEAARASGVAPTTAPKTVYSIMHDYTTGHLRAHRKNWKHDDNLIWRHMEPLAEVHVATIGRPQAHAFLTALAATPAIQRRMKTELSAAWEAAMASGQIPDGVNPWVKIRVAASGKRARVLSDTEVGELVAWLRTPGSTSAAVRDVLLLTLATGCRSGEVVGMQWKDIDIAAGEWQLRTTKNGLGRTVYLNTFAVGVLKGLQLGRAGVFGLQRQKAVSSAVCCLKLAGDCPVQNWTPHDLRRTMRTGLARMGCPHEVGELCLGHRLGGVAGIYNLYGYGAEQREWLCKWGAKLRGLSEV